MKPFSVITLAALTIGCSAEQNASTTTTPAEKSSAPVHSEKTNALIRLYAMDCGRIEMLDLGLFSANGEYAGRQNSAADMCFLVRHPKGDLIWDAGLPDGLNALEDGQTNGPFKVSVPNTMASQLAAIHVSPEDIEYFSVSHSHFDHVGNAGLFAGSTFLVDKDERAHMFREDARADPQSFALVAPLEQATTKEFDGDYDVFGDGNVKIIAAPGHTPGHTSLWVNLAKEGPVLLTGDLYHLLESREKRIYPTFNTDGEETLRSMDKFEALAEETGARVIVQHSLEHMNELPLAPEYLE